MEHRVKALHVPHAAIAPHVIQLVGQGQTLSESAEIDIQAVKERNKKMQKNGASLHPPAPEGINR